MNLQNHFHVPQQPHLKAHVRLFWQVDAVVPFQHETIIPKGHVEVIFDLSEGLGLSAELDGMAYRLPRCFINGFNTCPIHFQLPVRLYFFGVVFQPLAIKNLFGVAASEFSNRIVDLTLLNKEFDSVWHQLGEQQSFEGRVAIFSQWVANKYVQLHAQEQLLNSFLLNVSHPAASVAALAHTLCYSPRHLSRKIHEITGMNAEEALLYKKYLHAVHLMHHTDLMLTEVACQSHFADQSHFIKSFKAFAQMTPGTYRRSKSHLQGHIYQNVR